MVWSGFALFDLTLALIVARVRPPRLIHAVAGALFASDALAAAAIAAANAGLLQGDAYARVFFAAAAPGFSILLLFPFLYPHRRLGPRGEAALFAVAAGLVLLVWGAVGLAPDTFLPRTDAGGRPAEPLAYLAFFGSVYAFIGLGTLLYLDAYLGAKSPIQRDQQGFFLAAYALKAVVALRFGAEAFVGPFGSLQAAAQPALWLVALAVPSALVASRLRRSRQAGKERPPPSPWGPLAVLVMGLAALVGLLGASTYRLAWLVCDGLFAYGILKFHVLDVDERGRRVLLAAGLIVGAGIVYVVALTLLDAAGVEASIANGVGLMAALAAAGLARSAGERFRLAEPRPEGPGGSPARRAYLAALEAAIAEGNGRAAPNERILRALRSRLGVSEREHALLEGSVRASLGIQAGAPAVGARFLGKYRVEAVLGEGGFGRAYLAYDDTVQRRVVLKVAQGAAREDVRRALREARILARLGHPHIVALHDVEEVGEEAILVLEYVPGGSLGGRLAKGPLRPDEALALFDDVLAALEAAHAEGVVHRDVKPANILLTHDGRAKLADFGVARAAPGSGTATGASFEPATPGTLRYMSPEQVLGRPLDARSDLYAAGVVLYEALAGKPYLAFDGKAEFEVRQAIVEDTPWLPIAGAPQGVNELLAAVLSKEPANRPASAAEMRRRLRAAMRPRGASRALP